MRQRQKSRQSSRGAGVEIVTIAEMQFLRDALERVSAPGLPIEPTVRLSTKR